MMDTVQSIKEACETVLVACHSVLDVIRSRNSDFILEEKEVGSNIVNHDPGLRQPVKSDNERRYLISIGPHQPKLSAFPSDGKDRFNPQWFKEFEYLEYSTSKDSAYCFACWLFPKGIGREKAESAWCNEGVKNWGKMKSSGSQKLGKLEMHFKSSAHKAAVSDYCHFMLKQGYVEVLIDKNKRNALLQEERILAYNTEVVAILADVSRTLGRQGLAFRGSGSDESGNYRQVVQLIARHNPILKNWLKDTNLRPYHVTYLSPDSQNEFIELVADEVTKVIVQEIAESPFYTVMADTTPDSSHKDILSVVVRSVDGNGIPRERLLEVLEAKDKTGNGLAKDIIKSLQTHEIDIANLAFQSYDFASSMSGEFKGAQQKLTEIVNHLVPYIPCQAHRTNTAVEHSCRTSTIILDMFNILEELYVFFTSSTKRFQPLKTKLNAVENSIGLRNLSITRWTARAESIQAVNASFESIVELLKEISETQGIDSKTKTKAFGLRKRMLSFDFIVSLMFMKTLMYKMKLLTEALESPELNIIDVITLITSTVKSLEIINNDSDAMDKMIDSSKAFATSRGVDAESDFNRHHRRRLTPKRLDESSQQETRMTLHLFFRREFKCVLDTMITLLQSNVQACVSTVRPLFVIFQTPVSRKVLTIENLKAAIELFPCAKNRPDVYALQSEMEVLFDNCKDANSMSDIMSKAREVKHILKLAFRLAQLVITAGFSVATNERKFSQLKFVKNVLRSTMADDRLKSLMLLTSEKDLVDDVKLANIVSSWAQLKNRRISVCP